MQLSPECQALSFGPGRTLAAEILCRTADERPQRRYNHFHPAAELVWFRSASSILHLATRTIDTGTGDLVYLPPMVPHDFEVSRGPVEFVLILFDPVHEQRLAPRLQSRLSSGPAIYRPDALTAKRMDMLADWLVTASSDGTDTGTAERLLDLILGLMVKGGATWSEGVPPAELGATDPLARLSKTIAMIHADPAKPLDLATAAAACHLSPAYFARLFKSRMGVPFTDYLQAHRLNLAARLVAATDLPIAQIAYRTGFGSPSHLSNRFAERFGVSPRVYRQSARNSPLFRARVVQSQPQASLSLE